MKIFKNILLLTISPRFYYVKMHIWFYIVCNLFLVILYEPVLVESHHIGHHAETKEIFTTSDNFQVNSLGGSENELSPNESPSTPKLEHNHYEPPVYLNLMFETLMNEDLWVPSNNDAEPVLRALFPVEVTTGEFGSTILVFNVSRDKWSKFNSAHVILTRRNDKVHIKENSIVNVNIQFQNQENILSQRMWEYVRFYTFNISDQLRNILKGDEQDTITFDLKSDVFKNNRKRHIFFNDVFDTETEKPFIIFEYRNLEMTRFIIRQQNQERMENSQSRTRSRRSVERIDISVNQDNITENEVPMYPSIEPPKKTVCRRHEWLVTPSEVGLDDVIRPRFLDLGFCSGTCPYPLLNDVFNFTLHSYFIDQHRLLRGFNVPNDFPVSNCIPVSYKQLMLMELDADGQYVVKTYSNASVDSCGCR